MSIKLENVNYLYSPGTAYEKQALKDINLEIKDGEFIGIIGHTGSGKSTLIQHLDGLLQPTSGKIFYDGEDVLCKGYNKKNLRTQVGLVFQYPEHQLFEVDVFSDVCFGPKNLGLSKEEVEKRAHRALELVHFPKECYNKSPFELSGGQKRRAAIAGVLAMEPKVIILDEPTVGLDPIQIREIRDLIKSLGNNHTVLISSHILSEIQNMCEKILIISHGKLIAFDEPEKLEDKLMSPNNIKITTDADVEATKMYCNSLKDIKLNYVKTDDNGYTEAEVNTGKNDIYKVSKELFLLFASNNKILYQINLKKTDLEDIFVELTEISDEADDIEKFTEDMEDENLC